MTKGKCSSAGSNPFLTAVILLSTTDFKCSLLLAAHAIVQYSDTLDITLGWVKVLRDARRAATRDVTQERQCPVSCASYFKLNIGKGRDLDKQGNFQALLAVHGFVSTYGRQSG